MSSILTSPLNLVPMTPDYRPWRLRCRFTIAAGPCHRTIPASSQPRCDHLDRAMYQAGRMFLDDMEQQGWQPIDGRLRLTGGPFPETPVDTADLPKPVLHQQAPSGPHQRFGPSYDSPVVARSTLDTTDGWEYELSGWFVRRMLPTVMTVNAAAQLEAKRRRRLRGR